MILDLVRHGDTGRRGHLDGHNDPALVRGAADAVALRHADIAWRQVISSPLRRAVQTADALAAGQGLPVQPDLAWREMDFGDWNGRHVAGLPAAELAAFHAAPQAHAPPNAEPWPRFSQRIAAALHALARAGDGAPVLVVSHAGALRLALSLACALPLPALWAQRIDYGTRIRLRLGLGADDALWGELVELVPLQRDAA